MGKGSPAQPHFPRIFAFYDTSSAGSLQGGKNECRFAEVSYDDNFLTLPYKTLQAIVCFPLGYML